MKPKKKNIQIKDILVCHLFEKKKFFSFIIQKLS